MNVRIASFLGMLCILLSCFSHPVRAQATVGNAVEFGGVTALLDDRGRQRLQQEVERIYANRPLLTAQLEQYRQLAPFLDATLRKVSLPADFRYLALPLSSSASFWNIPATQQNQLGLQTENGVLEALHPLLATEAAVVFLARLQERTANPLRVAIQYLQLTTPNGPERLTGTGDLLLLDANSPPVVWKLLARRLVLNYEEPMFRPNRAFVLWTHTESNGRSLSDIAFSYKLPTDRIQPYDGWLRTRRVPAAGFYPVLIRMTLDEYASAIRSRNPTLGSTDLTNPDLGFPVLRRMAPIISVLNMPVILYEINSLPGVQAQSGDNAITLSYYGKISVRNFLQYNDMTTSDVVRPGEVYYLAPKARRAKVPYHVVGRGQTLREVANQYGVRMNYLLRYNELESNQRLVEGRVLWLQGRRPKKQPVEYRQLPPPPRPSELLPDSTELAPTPPPDSTARLPVRADSVAADTVLVNPVSTTATVIATTAVTPKVETHTVRVGETYFGIAKRYGIPIEELYRLNKVSGRMPLPIGKQLRLNTPTRAQLVTKPKPAPARPRPKPQGMRMKIKIEPIPATEAAQQTGPVRYYVVQPRQTVYRVALINKVTVEQIVRWNNLKSYTIEVGQRLVVGK